MKTQHRIRRPRYPDTVIENGVVLCRGCRKPVPKGRQTWCSNECYETKCPQRVRFHVWERDKGVCSDCGVDTQRMANRMQRALRYPEVSNWDYSRGTMFNREDYEKACKILVRHRTKVWNACAKRKASMIQDGWPSHTCRDWWEADHIIPHSEGGEYVLENMRTLCVPCHKKRTKQWHKVRKLPKNELQLVLSEIETPDHPLLR